MRGATAHAALIFMLIVSAAAFSASAPRAFLTREQGANDQLRKLLTERGVITEELPCIAFQKTEGYNELCTVFATSDYDSAHPWVVMIITPRIHGRLKLSFLMQHPNLNLASNARKYRERNQNTRTTIFILVGKVPEK